MKNFDISNLDYYYQNRISFRCSDIINWCKSNFDNSDFNISYAAKELYNHYFSDENRMPKKDTFFYIIYNEYAKNLYRIIKDKVMCGFKTKDYIPLEEVIKRTDSIIDDIKSSDVCSCSDIAYINKINNVYKRRMSIMVRKKKSFNLKYYHACDSNTKHVLYNIHKDKLDELQLILFTLRQIEKR